MIEALMSGAFLSASLQVLLDRVASCEFVNLLRGRKHADGLSDKLKANLLALKALTGDAEDKQLSRAEVKAWLDELQHAIYIAEDLLDEVATKALATKSKVESQCSTRQVGLSRFLCPIKQFMFPINTMSTSIYLTDEEIESRIKLVLGKFECFVEQAKMLGLKEGEGGVKWSSRLQTTCLVDQSGVFGRNKDKEKIIELLLSSDLSNSNEIPVIPIVGMAGVGKTTLAQLVYNDGRADEKFDLKMWVYVSEAFDVSMITKKIVDDVTQSNNDMSDLNKLQIKLKESLTGKKFLLVLDDVWNDNYVSWDILKRPFKAGSKDSRIIVTTRVEDVARVMHTVPSHQLQQLSFEDCWSIFAKCAFENGDHSAHPNLERIGMDIVARCKGLPLAVKSLGGLLRSKLEPKEWDNVLESEIWDLQSDILPALRLSYHYLPSHLKRCFAFCSLFPKGYKFEREELVQLWIAEEFVQQHKNKLMEDECNSYFGELLSRSLFQQLSCDTHHGAACSCVVMHDLVHDLAQLMSGEFCFMLDNGKLSGISDKVRHFSYIKSKYDASERFRTITGTMYLRTFISFHRDEYSFLGNKMLHEILPSLRWLRVLSLSGYHISELPQSIGNLIHLRYLDLSRTRIRYLPNSATNLCNLLTLNLSDCELLTELPTDMGRLINLRHLYIEGTHLREMPMEINKLRDLQHLSDFVVGKESGSGISALKEIGNLRGNLSIASLQNVADDGEALEAKLKEKKRLEKLTLKWNGTSNDHTDDSEFENDLLVLDKLQPPQNVIDLIIKGYRGSRFPDGFGDHSFLYLVSLRLGGCVNCWFLPSLGQLPSLKHLEIVGLKEIRRVGPEFYGNTSIINKPFKSLESLTFEDMPEWNEWNESEGCVFSHLSYLCIRQCPKLKGDLPSQVPTLRTLRVYGCQQLEAFERMLQHWPSISLSSLQELDVSDLSNLKQIPPELCRLSNLKELGIWRCRNLVSFPETGLPPMLRTLRIHECGALKSLPKMNAWIQHLSIYMCPSLMYLFIDVLPVTLKELNVRLCRNLLFCSSSQKTKHLGSSVEHLYIRDSIALAKSLQLGFFPNLASLNVTGLLNLETLLVPIQDGLQNLKGLQICDCPNMVSFPDGGLAAPNLMSLYVGHCNKLKSLPQGMRTLLPSLQSLEIWECPELESFPDEGLPSKLRSIEIRHCKKINFLPQRMRTVLTSLESMKVEGCPELESFPDGGLPCTVRSLGICDCPRLTGRRREWNLQRLPSLREFTIEDEHLLESFPEEWLLPITLTSLRLRNLGNLKSLNQKGLQRLANLESLFIDHCPRLLSWPKNGLSDSVSFLSIQHCPLLTPRCRRKKGKDWPKIARIRCIKLDDEVILE